MEEPENEETPNTREQLEIILKKDDGIMEPDCLKNIKNFMDLGGNPAIVVQLLAVNYKAVAQTVNLLASWLIQAGVEEDQVKEQVENHLQELIIKHFDPKAANEILTKNEKQEVPQWLSNMIRFKKWRQTFYKLIEEYPDCLMLNFAIRLISNAGYQGEITNVKTACTQSEVFARVFKTLLLEFIAEDDFDSLMNSSLMENDDAKTVKKDNEEEGGEEKKKDNGFNDGSNMKVPKVKNDKQSLQKLLELNESKNLTELCQLACHSEHTYLLTQGVFQTLFQHCQKFIHEKLLSRNKSNIKQVGYCFELKVMQIIRKISQDLERAAHRRGHASAVESIASFQYSILYDDNHNVKTAVDAIYAVISRGNLSPNEITTLFSLYHEYDPPPPVIILQNPLFLETIVSYLFSGMDHSSLSLDDDLKDKTIQLLGYAVSVVEKNFLDDDRSSLLKQSKSETRMTVFSIQQTLDIIKPQKNLVDTSILILSDIKQLFDNLQTPVVARGLLQWIEDIILHKSKVGTESGTDQVFDHYWDRVRTLNLNTFITGSSARSGQRKSAGNSKLQTTSIGAYHLALIDEIVLKHPTLHPKVAILLMKMFEQNLPKDFDTSLQLDIRKCILDRMVHLVSRGFYTMPILVYIKNKALSSSGLDASLLRYFILQMLNSVQSPYSLRFQKILKQMISLTDLAKSSEITSEKVENNVKNFLHYVDNGCDIEAKKADGKIMKLDDKFERMNNEKSGGVDKKKTNLGGLQNFMFGKNSKMKNTSPPKRQKSQTKGNRRVVRRDSEDDVTSESSNSDDDDYEEAIMM